MHEITIEVRGEAKTGKSTVAAEIYRRFKAVGFEVDWLDEEGSILRFGIVQAY